MAGQQHQQQDLRQAQQALAYLQQTQPQSEVVLIHQHLGDSAADLETHRLHQQALVEIQDLERQRLALNQQRSQPR